MTMLTHNTPMSFASVHYRDQCGVYLHAWEPLNIESDGVEEIWSARCIRCASTRLDFVDANTRVLRRRRYLYPVDYKMEGQGRMLRNEWRNQFIADLNRGRRR